MAIAEREITAPAQNVQDFMDEDFVPSPYRWTREQFHQLGEVGLFDGHRVILMEGEILAMPPVGNLHRGIVTVASAVLRDVFGLGFFVREEKPFEIYRHPQGHETQPFGFGYAQKTVHESNEIVQPLGAASPVAVSALLPQQN